MSKENKLKEGFEFLQPILDANIDFPFQWKEDLEGYLNLDTMEVLIKDGIWYCPNKFKRDLRLKQYEQGEIEKDNDYEWLKKWYDEDAKITQVPSHYSFDVEEFIRLTLAPKIRPVDRCNIIPVSYEKFEDGAEIIAIKDVGYWYQNTITDLAKKNKPLFNGEYRFVDYGNDNRLEKEIPFEVVDGKIKLNK
ncbi:hypothetical protein [Sphingobacterium sp. 1.A.5]|uniref:hypothetical protein n=1 Tax=Sphingobacterium sp. 1.A.5 TaxID=2044604 RepID=UPI000C0BCB73|nr:hypothetical protein [Sphingobacterium sp. 1.A.5]